MFFVISKLFYFLMMPVSWLIGLMLFALFLKKTKWKKRCLYALLALTLISTNPLITNELMLWWESAPTPYDEVESYEVGILLTGVALSHKSPHDRTYFLKGADRVTHTVELYKKGNIKKILITGAAQIHWTGSTGNTQYHPIQEALIMLGVPDSSIIWENEARNTHENATFSAKSLAKQSFSTQKKHLLITSAFHMRRAKACFEKQNINIDTFSTDFYTTDRMISPSSFLPSAYAFLRFSILVKEMLGYTVYKMMGYV